MVLRGFFVVICQFRLLLDLNLAILGKIFGRGFPVLKIEIFQFSRLWQFDENPLEVFGLCQKWKPYFGRNF